MTPCILTMQVNHVASRIGRCFRNKDTPAGSARAAGVFSCAPLARRQAIKKLRSSGHWLTLLRVARTIAQPFTLNDISVAVWRACPEFFGMKGYPYPDNHKVHYILYGTRGLIAKGIIKRLRQGLFRVAEEPPAEPLLPGCASGEESASPASTS